MFITQRKQPSVNRLNTTELLDRTVNESLADSTGAKRFTRTKNVNDDNGRTRKLSRASDSCNEDDRKNSKDAQRNTKMPKFIHKPQELFLRISETPLKKSSFCMAASSDRTTESSFFPDYAQRQSSFLTMDFPSGKEFLTEFQDELQLKNGQVMLLEDEVMRLRKALLAKEEQHSAQAKKREIQVTGEINGLKEEIKRLKIDIQEKSSAVAAHKKNQFALNRQIKTLKYEKMLLEKQIEQLYKKKLPKQLKDLMSYRELSLMAQLDDLKQKLQASKTEHEAQLEQEVLRLKQENISTISTVNTLNAQSHVLSKKLSQKEAHIREKTENFGRCYSTLKENHTEVLNQLKIARKENIKLRRLHAPKAKLAPSSSEESLTFSVTSNN